MFRRLFLAGSLAFVPGILSAQESPNLMIVLDGSGSMWGQVDGEAKITLARRALSQVLEEATPDMEIGLIAYGHRQRGQCSDIEVMVPMGPAMQTVPQIIAAANAMTPRGMTPISDAVTQAAEAMAYTEQAATVVLLTDGIETCDGDPCALGRALAMTGIDFRAHVVGFDMSDADQRTVACLADETGGMFIAANDAGSLTEALARTLAPVAPPDPPAPAPAGDGVLTLTGYLSPGVAAADGRYQSATQGTERFPIDISIIPIVDGAPDTATRPLTVRNAGSLTLPPGDYLVRATAFRSIRRESLVRVTPGGEATVEINMGLRPVFIDFAGAANENIVHLGYDPDGPRAGGWWRSGYFRDPSATGDMPVHLPPGEWLLSVGRSTSPTGRENAIIRLSLPDGPGDTITVQVPAGARPSEADLAAFAARPINPCLNIAQGNRDTFCLIEEVTQQDIALFQSIDRTQSPSPAPAQSPAGADPALIPAGLATFLPASRWDYAWPDGNLAASLVFAEPVTGGDFGYVVPGFVWLAPGWCGPGCAADILPLGGPDPDSVQDPPERLSKGGVFPALDLSAQGIIVLEGDARDWPNLGLIIHVLDQPYDEGVQLGPDNNRVLQSFGPFAGGEVKPATLDSWPQAAAVTTPEEQTPFVADLPAIGAIDTLPTDGIFVAMPDMSSEPLDLAFARLHDGSGDSWMGENCATMPIVVHPDGMIAERERDPATPTDAPAYRTIRFQLCEQAGPLMSCAVFLRPPGSGSPTPDFDYRAELIGGPNGSFALRDLETGRAMLYRECRGPAGFIDPMTRTADGGLLIDAIFAREDQPRSDAPARPTAPSAAETPLMIPPGLWHTQGPWSDPMPAPGTPAYVERCFDGISATFPDGRTIGFEPVETSNGPDYIALWSEICVPSGDPVWPLNCLSEDANLSDDVQLEPGTMFMRVETASRDRVTLTIRDEIVGETVDYVLHACLRDDGAGVDLRADPRGQALLRVLADVQPGFDLGLLSPGPEATPASTLATTDPRPALSGLWFPLEDWPNLGAVPASDKMAACFDMPGRFHDDGLFVAFRTRDGIPLPDSHMRCDEALRCDFATGAPSDGQPVVGRAELSLITKGELRACIDGHCLTLGRCPALDWSARERASGLAAAWEAAVSARE